MSDQVTPAEFAGRLKPTGGEEPHHAAARRHTDEEQAVIDLLRERAAKMRRIEPDRMPAERLVGRARSHTVSGASGAPGGVKRAVASDRLPHHAEETP